MSLQELRAEIEACIDDCMHTANSPTEHMILMSKCVLYLAESILVAAEHICNALDDLPGGGPGNN